MKKSKTKKLTKKFQLSKKQGLIFAAVFAVIAGIFIYNALAVSQLYYFRYNYDGIGHNHGQALYDSKAGYTIWQDSNSPGFSWYGPYYKQNPGKYRACFSLRVPNVDVNSKIYLDVTKDRGATRLGGGATITPSSAWNGQPSSYFYDCVDYTVSTTAYNVEWRADVRASVIDIANVKVFSQ